MPHHEMFYALLEVNFATASSLYIMAIFEGFMKGFFYEHKGVAGGNSPCDIIVFFAAISREVADHSEIHIFCRFT